MKQKLVVAKMPVQGRDKIVTVLYEDNEAVEIYVKDAQSTPIVGNIYLGHVNKAGTGGYFINYDGEHEGFLPSRKAKGAVFKTPKKNAKINCGDELLVMVDAEGVKTKLATLTCDLSIAGINMVVSSGFAGVKFSSKLGAEDRKRIASVLSARGDNAGADADNIVSDNVDDAGANSGDGAKTSAHTGVDKFAHTCLDDIGLIIRTSAGASSQESIVPEAKRLSDKLRYILKYGTARPYGTCLYRAGDIWLEKLKAMRPSHTEKIVTDIPEVYEDIRAFIAENHETDMLGKLSFYDDKMLELYRLYSLASLLDSATSTNVWLKSGASVVIEQTEAFVSIDVNSAKSESGKNSSDEHFRINVEAAKEIAKQIRLRQLSGIILIDFINMKSKEKEQRLIEEFSLHLAKDPAKAKIIDITPLGIMELTRRKKTKTLSEQIER